MTTVNVPVTFSVFNRGSVKFLAVQIKGVVYVDTPLRGKRRQVEEFLLRRVHNLLNPFDQRYI